MTTHRIRSSLNHHDWMFHVQWQCWFDPDKDRPESALHLPSKKKKYLVQCYSRILKDRKGIFMYAAIKHHMRRNVAVLIVLIRVRGSWSGNYFIPKYPYYGKKLREKSYEERLIVKCTCRWASSPPSSSVFAPWSKLSIFFYRISSSKFHRDNSKGDYL